MNNIWGRMPINTISFMVLLVAIMGVALGWLLHAQVVYYRRKYKHREKVE